MDESCMAVPVNLRGPNHSPGALLVGVSVGIALTKRGRAGRRVVRTAAAIRPKQRGASADPIGMVDGGVLRKWF